MIKYSFLLTEAGKLKTAVDIAMAKTGTKVAEAGKKIVQKPALKTALDVANQRADAMIAAQRKPVVLKPIRRTPAPVPTPPVTPVAPTAQTPGRMKLKPIKKPVPPAAPAAPTPRTQDQIMSDITNWNKKNAASTTAAPNPAASGKTLAPGITERTYRRPPPSKPVTPITPMTPEAKAAQAQRQQAVKDKMGVGETFKKQKEEEIRLARQKKAEALRAKKARGETMKKIGSTAWSGTKKTLGYTAAGLGGAGVLAYNSLQPNSK